MPVRLDAERDGPAVRLLDVARQAVDAVDAPGLRDHAALERRADETLEERARLSRVRQRGHERRSLGVAMHVRQQLRERVWGDQVAGREPRPVLEREGGRGDLHRIGQEDRKSTRLNSSHSQISYAVFCLKKKKKIKNYVHLQS